MDDPATYLAQSTDRRPDAEHVPGLVLAPIESQEVWGAGVTYTRSRHARVAESKESGASAFYDRVSDAERPELFFKCAGWRVCRPGEDVRVRSDARWSVPEPEIALYVNPHGRIVGWTIGNDMSARDIEGENPLYIPQAKIYNGACALGPAMVLAPAMPSPETTIRLIVRRDEAVIFEGDTPFSRMRRDPAELVEHLYRETLFPAGCVLLTGTGIVPPDELSRLRAWATT